MADNSFKIVARLDIPQSTSLIKDDIKTLESKLKSQKIKITAGLDIAKSRSLIQSQLDTLSSKIKAPAININVNANKTTPDITDPTQLKYLNKIKEETNTIISLKKKMVNAGVEESAVYQHEITKAQKRIQYDVQQLQKKKLLTDEAQRLVNTYKEQIALQDRINSAKATDKGVKQQTQEIKSYQTEINKAITQLNTLQKTSAFSKNASNPQVAQTKQEIAQLLTEYNNLKTQLQGNVTPTGLESIKTKLTELGVKFQQATNTAKTFSTQLNSDNSAEKLAQKVQLLTTRIKTFRQANQKSEKMFGSQYDEMLSTLTNPNIDENTFNRINKQFQNLRQEIIAADKAGQTLWGTIKEKATKFASWMTMTYLVSSLARSLRDLVTNVIEVDKAMVNLKKVTDETEASYSRFLKNSAKYAQELHATMTDLIEQVATWSKLGFSMSEAENLAKVSMIYSKVGEVDNTTAVSDLVTVMKAFNIESTKSISIVDSLNQLGKLIAPIYSNVY